MTNFRLKCAVMLALAASTRMQGASTATWEMNSYQDFLKGRFSGVSLDRDGRLHLAPKLSQVLASGEAAIWSLAEGSAGVVYAGTGHGGRVFRIDAGGQATEVWKSNEPEVFAVAFHAGTLYAATSPDGRIYKIDNGKAAEFFDPHAKYIWSLAFAPDGSLFVGTGNQGKIYRVDASGQGEVYYDTGQSHVTSLAVDSEGRLLAGSEPNGILYRVTGPRKAFALYNASLPEIRALAQGKDGSLYAAAMGGSVTSRVGVQSGAGGFGAAGSGSAAAVSVTVTDSASAQAGPDIKLKPTAAPASSVAPAATGYSPIVDVAGVEKSAVYRIYPDNTVETLWSTKDENIYDLALIGGEIFLATDVRGRVYRLDADRKTTLVTQTGEGEATRLLPSAAGLLAATGDAGKVLRIGPDLSANGWYETPVHDAGTVARWGRINWRSDGAGNLRFMTRTGNSARPDATWSDWSPVAGAGGNSVASPNARYLQWRLEMEGPVAVENVTVAYLPQNAPPAVRSILVTGIASSSSSVKSTASAASTASYSVTVTDTGETPSSLSSGTPSQTMNRPGGAQIQVSWQADDTDGDKLVYSLFFRGEGEQTWKLLKDNLTDNTYNLDGDALADGRYFFRVLASDRPSNPPNLARETDLISAPVLIDNTPPVVRVVSAKRQGATAEIDVEATDAASTLKRCEYSIDAGPWTLVEAADGITDSPREEFLIRPAGLSPGEHLIVIRVYDGAGNAALAKTLLP